MNGHVLKNPPCPSLPASGCARCNIARKFMQARGIAYEEHDAVGEGKERFGAVLPPPPQRRRARQRRASSFRCWWTATRSGRVWPRPSPTASGGDRLWTGSSARASLPAGWVGGIRLSTGDPAALDELAALLGFLKNKRPENSRLETDGRNASVLEHLREVGIGDRVVMDIKGPQALYGTLAGCAIDPAEIGRSMAAAAAYADRRFETRVAPVADAAGGLRYLTPEEIAQTACWLKEATGSSRQPYFLKVV
jgi:hypothetical protein